VNSLPECLRVDLDLASYFEWVRNPQHFAWTREEIRHRAEQRLINATQELMAVCDGEECSLREAAYHISTGRLKEVLFASGF